MTAAASPRVRAYLGLAAAGLLAGLLLGRPEPSALTAPFLLSLLAGLALVRRPQADVEVTLDRDRALEGEEVELQVTITAHRTLASVEVVPRLPSAISILPAGREPAGSLPAGQARTFVRRLHCRRWGAHVVDGVELRVRDPLGLLTWSGRAGRPLSLRVFPRPETLRRLLRPAQTQAWAGDQVSRLKGEGIEFADVRSFVPGDQARRVNWRVSARRGELHVNEMHPERNADLVLFLDAFSELQADSTGTLAMAVRSATALAAAHLTRRDRVGLVSFGGTLRWLRPEMGTAHLYRLVDALLDTEVVLSYAWKGLEVIPARVLPPKSLVVALSPLLDDRVVAALLDLRGRGHDLVVVELVPDHFARPGRREVEQLAYKLWQMDREALRGRFEALGAPVVRWHPGEQLQPIVSSASAYRRRSRLARL